MSGKNYLEQVEQWRDWKGLEVEQMPEFRCRTVMKGWGAWRRQFFPISDVLGLCSWWSLLVKEEQHEQA